MRQSALPSQMHETAILLEEKTVVSYAITSQRSKRLISLAMARCFPCVTPDRPTATTSSPRKAPAQTPETQTRARSGANISTRFSLPIATASMSEVRGSRPAHSLARRYRFARPGDETWGTAERVQDFLNGSTRRLTRLRVRE